MLITVDPLVLLTALVLDAADMSQDAAMCALFRKAASTIDDLRNGYGG